MLYPNTWRRTALAVFFVAAAVVLAAAPAHAGRSCEAHKPTPQLIERGMQLAQQTAAALDAEHARSGAQVVVLGRAGQDLGKYGLRYSHLGWAYRTAEGPWRVVHKLNECGTAVGHLYRQGLGEFFLDDLWRYEAVWAVPTPEVQQRLLPVLQDRLRARALQHSPYSMVSYVWGRTYQQSNQWALETLAVAMEPASVRTRNQAQAWLQFKGYEPSVLKIGALTRLGGRVGSANIAFDDHPSDKRFADRIETVTVDSVLAWLQRAQLASAPVVLRLESR
ncbi:MULTISPECIES: DUF2145 domain-containing protein [unclassified Simplicispira]|uniref:DUF2145 domain-containing protein n=1 Tax=unclassified Simplicispira TaxID=2630407 RepID=UPI000D5CDECD|nr:MULTISPECIES: DUF2145 domain-containing protein [unclassified Simplicispira]PVY57028.1 hypothetical protein C8D04_2301 [Simplicispira sp. 125]REG17973.1 hypothetical protein C8D01_2611 [Simplicispira sp. 110]